MRIGIPFWMFLVAAAAGIALAMVLYFHNRKQQQNDMVEDILNNIAQEKAAERLKEETSPVDDFLSQNSSAFHYRFGTVNRIQNFLF